MSTRRALDSLHAARALFAPIAASACEVAAFAYLDPEWRLLGLRHVRSPDAHAVAVPIRAIAADAIALDARGLWMAHTHPFGTAEPGTADIAVTRRLVRALDALDIRLHDHLLFAGGECVSFVQLRLL